MVPSLAYWGIRDMMSGEEMDGQPSLDQMLDLEDPEVLKGLGELAEEAFQKRSQQLQDLPLQRMATPEEMRVIAPALAALSKKAADPQVDLQPRLGSPTSKLSQRTTSEE